MSGKNSQALFKDGYGASSTAIVGNVPPEKILIVGVDVPLSEVLQDLWDEARLIWSQANPIDPQKILATINLGGHLPAVEVVKRGGLVYCVEGRRRVLGARAANQLLIKGGALPEELIELTVIPSAKGGDLEICVRVGNAGRLDDPPYVSAKNAQRLRSRGRDNAAICTALSVTPVTVQNYFLYLDVDPAIRALVEDPTLPKDQRLPFVLVVELGKLCNPDDPEDTRGPEQYARQNQALAYLRATGARLSGERGRENAKAVVRAMMAGQDLSAATVPTDESTDQDDPILLQVPVGTPGIEGLTETPAQPAIRQRGGATGQRNPATPPSGPAMNTGWKMSPGAQREVLARLEPTAGKPLTDEADQVAFAIMAVITGQDPEGLGLKKWPYVLAAFKGVLRSPVIDPSKCQNPTCDRGVDTKRKDTCKKCEGTGKAPKAATAATKGKK
jgi:hypothetical protein